MDSERSNQLCRVETADGFQLDGWLQDPVPSGKTQPVSAWLLVHGTGSQFYSSGVLETFATQAVQAGTSVLRVNTRGHDIVARIPAQTGSKWGGAAYETIDECRFDIAAWIEFLVSQGHQRIGLAGHSMGAVKVLYAQARIHHSAVQCVVGISPPRFCHQRLISHSDCQAFRDDNDRAEKLVADGRGNELFFVRQPLPLLLTAEGFLAKYGPHDDYDFLKSLPSLGCPGLILVGSESVRTSPAFAGIPEDVLQMMKDHPELPLAFELITGADTIYSGCQTEPFDHVQHWLDRRGE